MSKGLKQLLKVLGIILAVVIVLMILIPILSKDKIKDAVLRAANEQLEATVEIEDFGLSLFSNFPSATLELNNASIIGTDAFEGDTLLGAKQISVTIDLSSLFGDNYKISRILLDKAVVNAIVLENGKANWDIMKESAEEEVVDETAEEPSSFNLNLDKISIKSCRIVYDDRQGGMQAILAGWNGHISGDFNASETTLKTASTIDQLTFSMGGVPYIHKVKAVANASVNADLENFKFTFEKSDLTLNELKASIEGSFGLVGEDGMEFDLKLNAPDTQFKSVLSIVPAMYTNEFKDLQTDGIASLDAYIKGVMEGDNYPAFDVKLKVDNAMFKYPSLPKSVTDINLDLALTSTGGSFDNTVIDLKKLTVNLGGDNPFSGHLKVTTPQSNAHINAHIDGNIDLGIVKDVYPLSEGVDLGGQILANVDVVAQMASIEKERYEDVNAKGVITLKDMILKSEGSQDMKINNASLELTPRYINLKGLNVLIGKNDIGAEGRLENFIPFVLKNETIKGQLNINSSYLNLDDFMGGEATEEEVVEEDTPMGKIILPKNINFGLNADFKHIVFSKIDIKDVKGAMTLNGGKLSLNNVGANLLDGSAKITGTYDTSNPKLPGVNFSFDLARMSFAKTFSSVDAIKKLAPFFQDMEGIYGMHFDFNTTLGETSDATLHAVNGTGTLQTNNLKIENVQILDQMADILKAPGLKTIAPKDLKIAFAIKEGRITTSPFSVNLGDGGNLKLEGTTGLDQTIDYKGTVTLPKSMSNNYVKDVPLTIKGNFDKPKLGIDTKALAGQALGNVAGKLLGIESKDGEAPDVKGKLTEETAKAAKAEAQKIRERAKKNAEQMVTKAQEQADAGVEKAGSNKFAKAAAKGLGDKLVEEAKKAGDRMIERAEETAKKLEGGQEVDKAEIEAATQAE